jgi:hypothetical protein
MILLKCGNNWFSNDILTTFKIQESECLFKYDIFVYRKITFVTMILLSLVAEYFSPLS